LAQRGAVEAVFLISAFLPVGFVHMAWLKLSWSRRLSAPLDFGMTFRGRRIFGPNKMFRGLVVLVPGGGIAFFLLAAIASFRPWPISNAHYAGLGICAGLGFVLGELPNSFSKRQLDVPSGGTPANAFFKGLCFLVDHTDSLFGMLIAVRLMCPFPAATWIFVIVAGFFIHLFFSVVMFFLGTKARPL
jgi:hypothetical protein